MTSLFEYPIRVEITYGRTADEACYTVISRDIPAPPVYLPVSETARAVEDHLRRAARGAARPLGAVVLNAVLPEPFRDVGLLYVSATELRDATEEEAPQEVLELWTAQHRSWKRKQKPHARRAARTPGDATTLVVPESEHPTVPSEFHHQQAAAGHLFPTHVEVPPMPSVDRAPEPPRVTARERPAPIPEPVTSQVSGGGRVADMPSQMEVGKHDPRAREGWQGGLNMLGFHLPPGKDELYRRQLIASISAGWKGTGYATVMNEKGGSGKTPTVLMLAAALQAYGPGVVAVRDSNPTGNAHKRAEFNLPQGRTDDGAVFNDGDLAKRYLELGPLDATAMGMHEHSHTTDRYKLISHHVASGEHDQLTEEMAEASYAAMAPWYRAIITDTANVPWERRDVAALRRTRQLVAPFLAEADKEEGIRTTLGESLERWGGRSVDLVRNAVVPILIHRDDKATARYAREAEERWAEVVREVIVVPYDPHMSSTSLRLGELRDETRTAMLLLGAAVAEGFRAA